MTSNTPTAPNLQALPPPSPNDEPAFMAPPSEYRIPVTPQEVRSALEVIKGTAGKLGNIALLPEAGLTLENLPPENPEYIKPGETRVPTFNDIDYVYDALGMQLFNLDSEDAPKDTPKYTPKKWKEMGLQTGDFVKEGEHPSITTIDGKKLKPLDPISQNKTLRQKAAFRVFNFSDSKMNFMQLEPSLNMQWEKIVGDVKGNGPDHKYRILWAEEDPVTKLLVNYKGKPYTAQEVLLYEHEIRMAAASPAYAMACAKYELSKREEEVRQGDDGTWVKILNVMHQKLHMDPDVILEAVHQGLIYGRKTEDLTKKHTPLKYFTKGGEDGVEIPFGKISTKEFARLREAGSEIRLGELNERDFVTEFATKFGQGERRFGYGDVAKIYELAKEIERRLENGTTPQIRNRRNYQNAAFIASRLRSVANNSRMNTAGNTTNDEAGRMAAEEVRRRMNAEQNDQASGPGRPQQYEASIYSSPVANDAWREFVSVMDNISAKHPVTRVTNMLGDIKLGKTIKKDDRA